MKTMKVLHPKVDELHNRANEYVVNSDELLVRVKKENDKANEHFVDSYALSRNSYELSWWANKQNDKTI